METGIVKWFNKTKGYGFISPENGGNDIFIHISELLKSGIDDLNDGQKVSFDIEQGNNNKSHAVNVKTID